MKNSKIMSGKEYADEKLIQVKARTEAFKKKNNIAPGLSVILVGDDPASEIYVRNKMMRAREVGIEVFPYLLPQSTTQEYLLNLIDKLNNNNLVHAILVQLPLPASINAVQVLNRILPGKDVDGFSAISVGYLTIGRPDLALVPCTPLGCLNLLKKYEPQLAGKHAVIVSRSNIVGKPMSSLLLNENCTVTICHSKTKDLASLTSQGDIVITAIGKPGYFTAEYFKEEAIVLDVGINRIESDGKAHLVGDVAFDQVIDKVRYITPVPGGIGPMTIISLLENTCLAAERIMPKV